MVLCNHPLKTRESKLRKHLYASALVIRDLLGWLVLIALILIIGGTLIASWVLCLLPIQWGSLLFYHRFYYLSESQQGQQFDIIFFCFANVVSIVAGVILWMRLINRKIEQLEKV